MRNRPDGSHGAGGLLQVGGPVADALWLQGFGVALLTLCLFVGGKQKKETKITISTRKKIEHSMPSSSRLHRTETHTVLRVQPHPFANLAQVPLFPAPSATHPGAALGRLGVRVTNQPPGVGRGAPPRFVDWPGAKCAWHPWRHRDQCPVTMVSRVCSVTMVALGWCRPNVVALGHLVRLSRCAR